MRAADDPEAALLAFLETSYAAVASRADWDRERLEIPLGSFGAPYDVVAHRNR